jgi:hypothetical protein
MGALVWVAEQLDLIKLIDQSCGLKAPRGGPTVGEMVLAVAVQRTCAPAGKCHLAAFLESCVPRVSCLPASKFTGQAFHRLASQVTDEQLEKAQIEIARSIIRRFELSTDVLAFDTTNFDTHIATTTPGELARRGHAKSKRSDLRVVGLATLVSETGHVPLLHRTYPGNGSDQTVLGECLDALGKLHDALQDGDLRLRPGCRTLVRDGGSWSEQLELDLDVAGYYNLISLPLSHTSSQLALEQAARRGAMKPLGGILADVRAARLRLPVGDSELDRTLVVVESEELLRGQKRGIAVALRKAKLELCKLERQAAGGRMTREAMEARVKKALQREHLSAFVVTSIKESRGKLSLHWEVDAARRRVLERTRLGRRVLCTDHHNWSNGRIVQCGGTVPSCQEGRDCAMGAFSPVGRRLAALAYLRHSDRVDASQPGSPDTRQPEVGTEHHENSFGGESHPGAGTDQRTRSSCYGHAGARRDGRPAQGNQDLRVGPLDASTSFIYTSECTNHRCAASGMRK